MCAHRPILHRTTHFLLRCVHKNILDISVSLEYLFQEGDSYLNLMRDLILLLPRKIIETAPLMGTKGSMISQLLHQFNTKFSVNKNPQREFPSSQGDPSKMFCFDITLSNLNSFSLFFFEHARNIIPDISVSLEYFISVGEQSYFISSPVRGQLHQFPCLASNTSHNRLVFLLYTIIELFWTYLSLQNILYQFGGTSPFSHGE